ncbi:MAG: DUF6760 family protein [bacterium]
MEPLFEELSFVAYHFHWPFEEILELEHRDRHQLIEQISRINRRISEAD